MFYHHGQGPPHLALEHRPALWYETMRALGQLEEGKAGGAGGGRRGKTGYEAAACLPEKGLEQIEPLAFD